MKSNLAATVILAGLTSGALVSGARAQQQLLPAPGPPLAGICVYSAQAVLATSTAGVSANRKLAELSQSITGQLQPTGTQIDADSKALSAQKASLPAAAYEQKVAALQQRVQDLRNLAQTRKDQLERSRDGAINQINTATLPLLNASIAAHHCSIVVDKNTIYSVNTAMELTNEITQKLNAALPSVTFELAPPQVAR